MRRMLKYKLLAYTDSVFPKPWGWTSRVWSWELLQARVTEWGVG